MQQNFDNPNNELIQAHKGGSLGYQLCQLSLTKENIAKLDDFLHFLVEELKVCVKTYKKISFFSEYQKIYYSHNAIYQFLYYYQDIFNLPIENNKKINKVNDTLQILDNNLYSSKIHKIFQNILESGSLSEFEKKSIEFFIKEKFSTIAQTQKLNLMSLVEQFEKNIKKTHSQKQHGIVIYDHELLDGLPPEDIDQDKKDYTTLYGKGDGFFINIGASNYAALMHLRKLKNRNLRKKVFMKFSRLQTNYHNTNSNETLINKIFNQKNKIAKKHGYSNYAELVIKDFALSKCDEVIGYLENVINSVTPVANKMILEIKNLALKDGITKVEAWDTPYYATKLLQDVEKQSLSKHFEFNSVFEKIMEYISNSFGIKISKLENKINKNLLNYKLEKDGKTVYWLVNHNNDNNACCYANNLLSPLNDRDGLSLISFTFGTKLEDTRFLSIEDVSTVLHEIGHALHFFCLKNDEPELRFNNVGWDMIETPSQVFELLAYDVEFLVKLSNPVAGTPVSIQELNEVLDYKKSVREWEVYKSAVCGKLYFEMFYHYNRNNTKKCINKLHNFCKETGMVYNFYREDYMTSVDFSTDYGPVQYIYMLNRQIAASLLKDLSNNKITMKELFENIFAANGEEKLSKNILNYVDLDSLVYTA